MSGVIPTTANLLNYKGTQFGYNINTPRHLAAESGSASHEGTMTARLSAHRGALGLRASRSHTNGIWIPYAPKTVIFGFASGGAEWIGTGPFSGCDIALFTDGARVGMAHISRETGSTAGELWKGELQRRGYQLLSQWKVPLPSQTFYACSHVFLVLATRQITRIDVKTPSMGGGAGEIFNVKNLLRPD